ncbi:MAG: S41 family peptidase [Acidobacteriota bacterium]|nr:S41 family peptidase [Acidobacteriota bacterium]
MSKALTAKTVLTPLLLLALVASCRPQARAQATPAATPMSPTTQSSPLMLFGRVAVSRTHVAFFYAGDVWTVARAGGEAVRVPAPAATTTNFPAYSPDGSQLAFSRQTGGNWDVFVMPAAGGEARRLTFHPASDFVVGWTPDGRSVVFSSNRKPETRLYTIPAAGAPLPAELPLPRAVSGSFSPDGARIAYSPIVSNLGDWRYYRGGMKGFVWIANVRDGALDKLPVGDYNDFFPMWIGDKIYFVSDRDYTSNLYVYDLASKRARQLTTFAQYGIRWAAACDDAVAFVRDGRLHLYDLKSGETRVVPVSATPDTSELKPRAASASRFVESAHLSARGDRLALGARGEAIIYDPASGEARDLTQSPGVAERYPALSPDGRRVAYFSDESGEYQLHVRSSDGAGAIRKIDIEPKPTFYRELTWSPDSRHVAFTDHRLALWVADVDAGAARQVDRSVYSYQEQWFPAWSPDGRWLAYSKHLHNRVRTVFIYDALDGTTRQITDGRTHTESPVFDRNGKYLYFVSSPNAPTSEFGWGVLNSEVARPLVWRRLHALLLQADEPSPLLPNGAPNPDAKPGESVAQPRIDFDGLARRVVDLPARPRDYEMLAPGTNGSMLVEVYDWSSAPLLTGNPAQVLYYYNLASPTKIERLVEQVDGFSVSEDGRRLLYVKGRDSFLVASDAAPKADEGKLNLSKIEVGVDPRAEWRQMYREAWRIMRDWFYDPNHHGQNLDELERHYAQYLPTVTRRTDLNGLFNMMLGHVSVSHLGVGGGDVIAPSGQPVRVGLLGADYEIDQNRFRFKRVFRSLQYNSALGTFAAPLDRPGVSVREGEYLIAVDGENVDAGRSLFAHFENKVDRPVKITVGASADGAGARTMTVYPVANETQLRVANWAEENRRRVEQSSNGKLGYIYAPDYGGRTMDFIRGLAGNLDRPGLVIDQRDNGGGITPDYLIEWLRRRPIYDYTFREGEDIPVPVNPAPPVKVLITNERNFSAAETFAFMFKLARVGPLVGTRTGGGGIGPYVFTPQLIDGGQVQLPNRAAYNPDGTSWGIENAGISPDYEVEITPRDLLAGRDPQLEKAVQVALAEIAKTQVVAPKHPKYPVHR